MSDSKESTVTSLHVSHGNIKYIKNDTHDLCWADQKGPLFILVSNFTRPSDKRSTKKSMNKFVRGVGV